MSKKTIVSFGGGTNSTGMLVGMYERGWRPDAIWFADTCGEKPHTYQHIEEVNSWCRKVGFPTIETLKGEGVWTPQMVVDGSLEQECLRLGCLPSKAYGFGSCSMKWKLEPQKRMLAKYVLEHNIRREDVFVCVGFDAGESHRYDRAKRLQDDGKTWANQVWPLIEWGWDRDDCVEAIARAGIKQPGKSACFFCPSTKKKELVDMRNQYPELLARAVEMERRAMAGEGKAEKSRCGLGRSYAWGDYLKQGELAICDFGQPDTDCMCNDG